MIILSANNITKAYGTDVVLENISFHINEGDRVGLIGDNGAGKTTLLKILAGEVNATSGDFFISQDKTIGYLKQNDYFESEKTVYEEAENIFAPLKKLEEDMNKLSQEIADRSAQGENGPALDRLLARYDAMHTEFERKNGYSYKSEIVGILASMAFGKDFYDKKIATLSGGEKTRLALACMLLKKPDMLFLDEPTNHLDIGTLKWLEQYLKSYTGTILIISHDRYFLDKTVNRIFEIEHHKLYSYEGSYSEFAGKKQRRREEELKKYEQQQAEIAKQEEIIRRFKGHNTEKLVKRAQSREKMLAHMERLERPEALRGKIKINFKQDFQSGNDVLYGEELAKSFGYGSEKRELFKNVNFDIKRGERICIVGANGVGKTTLLKIMMKELDPDSGYIKIGHNVTFGYYDQGQLLLNGQNNLLEEMKDAYRAYTDTEMRSILGRFLFTADTVFQPISSLSGGERARLTLLKIMLSNSNVLILDEPTNHLDISSKEVFEEALSDYPGTVIVVSHDRYFLNRIPDRIFELTHEGIAEYKGTYDYYVEKKQSLESGKAYLAELSGRGKAGGGGNGGSLASSGKPGGAGRDAVSATEGSAGGAISAGGAGGISAAEQRRINKEQEAEKRRKQREEARLEEEIEKLESRIAEIEAAMCSEENFSNHVYLAELDAELAKLKEQVSINYEKWLTLQD